MSVTTVRPTPASSHITPLLAFQNAASPLRRGLIGGLVAGGAIAFLILIGIPSGPSEADGLPAWFVWSLFCLVAAAFGFAAARARTVLEQRAQTPMRAVFSGLVVGLAAAVVVVLLMLALNAAQLWEINLPRDIPPLPSGLKHNITRVQDVLANVSPRTTAIMAGLPLSAIDPPDADTPRADPTGRFILMSLLFPLAGMVGGGLSYLNRGLAERRERAAALTREVTETRTWRAWLPIALPVILFAFIILNAVPPSGPLGDAYRSLIGGNRQLAGLLGSFFMVGTGLIGIRSAQGERDRYPFALRAGALVAITLVFFAVGLAAPPRPAGDLMFSQKTPNLIQVLTPEGGVAVLTEEVLPMDTPALLTFRTLAILFLGVCFVVANLVGARGEMPLRSLIATNILLCSIMIVPLYLDKYQQSVLLLVGINVLMGMGLNIIIGYAGLLDLGYVSFYAIGAYTYAFLVSNQDIRVAGQVVGLKFGGNDQLMQGIAASLVIGLVIVPLVVIGGLALWKRLAEAAQTQAASSQGTARRPAWLAYVLLAASVIITQLGIALLRGTPFYETFSGFPMFIAGLAVSIIVAAIGSMLLGIPVLRLRGDYLAIVTLGFGEITRLMFNNLREFTGGPQGVVTIPKASFRNLEMASNEGMLYLILFGCIFVAFIILRIKASRIGRAWGAVRSDEDIAAAIGINSFRAKVLAYSLGAMFAAAGGVIFATRQGGIFPDNFTLLVSINVLCLVIIGGMGSIPGVIVGALVLIGVPESLRVFESYRVMAFGVLLVTMMILRPRGLLPQPPPPLAARARALADKGLGREPLQEVIR